MMSYKIIIEKTKVLIFNQFMLMIIIILFNRCLLLAQVSTSTYLFFGKDHSCFHCVSEGFICMEFDKDLLCYSNKQQTIHPLEL